MAFESWGFSPPSRSPLTPVRLWSQSAEHLRLLILEAMNAGVSPKSFGVSTSAPNTMRALIISTLSFCWDEVKGMYATAQGSEEEKDPGPFPLPITSVRLKHLDHQTGSDSSQPPFPSLISQSLSLW